MDFGGGVLVDHQIKRAGLKGAARGFCQLMYYRDGARGMRRQRAQQAQIARTDGIDPDKGRAGRRCAQRLAHALLYPFGVKALNRRQQCQMGKTFGHGHAKAHHPFHVVARGQTARHHQNRALVGAHETPHKARSGASGGDVIRPDIGVARGTGQIGNEGDDTNAFGHESRDFRLNFGGFGGDQGDSIGVCSRPCPQRRNQRGSFKGRAGDHIDLNLLGPQPSLFLAKRAAQKTNKPGGTVGNQKDKAILASPREVGRGDVADITGILDRLLHLAHRFFGNPAAIVHHPVYRRKADARGPGDIVNRWSGHGASCPSTIGHKMIVVNHFLSESNIGTQQTIHKYRLKMLNEHLYREFQAKAPLTNAVPCTAQRHFWPYRSGPPAVWPK